MEINFDEIYNQILKEKEECKDPCGICYQDLNKESVQLGCSHRYHYNCLFHNKNKYGYIECPYCRFKQPISSLANKCIAKINGKSTCCNKNLQTEVIFGVPTKCAGLLSQLEILSIFVLFISANLPCQIFTIPFATKFCMKSLCSPSNI